MNLRNLKEINIQLNQIEEIPEELFEELSEELSEDQYEDQSEKYSEKQVREHVEEKTEEKRYEKAKRSSRSYRHFRSDSNRQRMPVSVESLDQSRSKQQEQFDKLLSELRRIQNPAWKQTESALIKERNFYCGSTCVII